MNFHNPINDFDAIRKHYEDSSAWRVRQETHDKYTFPKLDFVSWSMRHVTLKGNETVLDVGCGLGSYYDYLRSQYPDIKYYGVDFSTHMLAQHASKNRLVRAPMQELPFADNSFDVVMANHVLYLAENIDFVVRETKRVLKPNGIFVASTNSVQTMPQFRELFRRAILLVSPPGSTRDINIPSPMHHRFSLENGSRILARHYYAVVRHDLPSVFIFPEVDPIMEYLESTRVTREPQLPANVNWDQVMVIMREQVTNLIISLQRLVIDKLTGVLIASNSGGFIEDFVEKRNELEQEANN